MPNVELSGSNQLRDVSTAVLYSSRYQYNNVDWLQFVTGFCQGTLNSFDETQKQLTDNTSITSTDNDKCKDIPLYAIETNGTKYHMHGMVGLNNIGIKTVDFIGGGANYKNNTAITYGSRSSKDAFMWNMHGRLDGGLTNIDCANAQNISITENNGIITVKLYDGTTEIKSASADMAELLPPYFYVVVNTPTKYDYELRYSFTTDRLESSQYSSWGDGTPYLLVQGYKPVKSTVNYYKQKRTNYTTGLTNISTWLANKCEKISHAWCSDFTEDTNIYYFTDTQPYYAEFNQSSFRCKTLQYGVMYWTEGIKSFRSIGSTNFYLDFTSKLSGLNFNGSQLTLLKPIGVAKTSFGVFSSSILSDFTFLYTDNLGEYKGIIGGQGYNLNWQSSPPDYRNPFLYDSYWYTDDSYPNSLYSDPTWMTGASTIIINENDDYFLQALGFENFESSFEKFKTYNLNGDKTWVFPVYHEQEIWNHGAHESWVQGLMTYESETNTGFYLKGYDKYEAIIRLNNDGNTSGNWPYLLEWQPAYRDVTQVPIYLGESVDSTIVPVSPFPNKPYLIDIRFHYKNSQ